MLLGQFSDRGSGRHWQMFDATQPVHVASDQPRHSKIGPGAALSPGSEFLMRLPLGQWKTDRSHPSQHIRAMIDGTRQSP